MSVHIVVPARIGSSRLPNKMLQKIGSKTLIVRAIERVISAAPRKDIIVATDSETISEMVSHLVPVIMTSANCRSGTDRCGEVAERSNWDYNDVVVNVQADMPFLDATDLKKFIDRAAAGGEWDMLTASCNHEIVSIGPDGFSREKTVNHVGLYAYRCHALKRFCAAETCAQEVEKRLEQTRAVEIGLNIDFQEVSSMPIEVNTSQDLAFAQSLAGCFGE